MSGDSGSVADPRRKDQVTVGAGHRRAKGKKASMLPNSGKATTPGGGKAKPATLTSPVVKAVSLAIGFLRGIPGAVTRRANRMYEEVAADPVRATKALAAVVVGVALLGGTFWFVTDRYARTAVARVEAADAAQDVISALLSYNSLSIDRQAVKTEDLRTGTFKDEYAQFIKDRVAPTAKEKQIAVQTEVDEVAVVDASPGEVQLLLYIEQQSDSKLSADGGNSSSTVEITVEKEDGKWKVSELKPV